MGMETAVSRSVVKLDGIAVLDEVWRVDGVPGQCAIDRRSMNVKRLCLVLQKPDIVFILVWVECDLLLLATSGIHKVVRMKISSLGVVMSDADTATKSDINWNILHSL